MGRVYDSLRDRILIQTPDRAGYIRVKLVDRYGERSTCSVHRLIAESFFDGNLDDYEVNHIDGDKSNNFVNNLEVTDRSGNMRHAYASGLSTVPKKTAVVCVETGEEFRTMREAARSIGVADHKSIVRVLDNPNRTTRGFHFVSSR